MSTKLDLSKAAHSHMVETMMLTANNGMMTPAKRASGMVAGAENKAALLTLCARNTAMYAAVELAAIGMTRAGAMLAVRALFLEVFDEAVQELDSSAG